ncbi:hypothetical protein CRM22_007210 [Opisthorchis felineus]|uniref:Granulins domain-containing protein n=1 Tax=Opisthorchis felineus TaxID=147828 RepID=A0A4S2LGY8_OPIFE|nr:hypothetical protein CRM22_007210 [Opisthorchis felineus]
MIQLRLLTIMLISVVVLSYRTDGVPKYLQWRVKTGTGFRVPIRNPVCSDPVYRCPDDQTCCQAHVGFGCCPMPDATCCNDREHCCPNGTYCAADGRCVRKSSALSPAAFTFAFEARRIKQDYDKHANLFSESLL